METMSRSRPPAVAGLFYPAEPGELSAMLEAMLGEEGEEESGPLPEAIIVPHAGYVYSGPVAATAYRRLRAARGRVHRVVLVGPSHRVSFSGLAVPTVDAFATPLGTVPVDPEGVARAARLPGVSRRDDAHAEEHSLEVHLPFLQEVLGSFRVVPLVVGAAGPETVARVLEELWDGPETLVVVSSDLSHFHDYDTARRLDGATARAIEELRWEEIGYQDACGRDPIKGLLYLARKRGLAVETLDLRSSGDTSGDRHRVVGYGAFAVGPPAAS